MLWQSHKTFLIHPCYICYLYFSFDSTNNKSTNFRTVHIFKIDFFFRLFIAHKKVQNANEVIQVSVERKKKHISENLCKLFLHILN